MKSKLPIIALIVAISSIYANATAFAASNTASSPKVFYSKRNGLSPELRDIKTVARAAAIPGRIREIPLMIPDRFKNGAVPKTTQASDTVVQKNLPGDLGPSAPALSQSFEGLNNVNGNLPSDTNGAVGLNHYIQMTNVSFALYDKTGTLLYGPANNNTLFTGFGGPCETTNDGDPIVLYDQLADRWLMSQFALPGPYYQCIAISKTGDPMGAWHLYEFQISATKMNDYPKIGIWPDGYYMSANQFASGSFVGVAAVAFERDAMLQGLPAQMVYFDLGTNTWSMLPSDLDGFTPPPPGSPNYFVQFDDNAWGYPQDQLEIWEFSVNWNNTSLSTFKNTSMLGTASFDANMCGYNRNCIPQPGGTNVDAISLMMMFRMSYRNFGSHESLLLNHTVDENSADHAGIRWTEVRDPGGSPYVYQEGTYAPDSDHRWMGSIAMDGAGNIGLGYSVSSTVTYPSIRYTGRLVDDPLGTLPLSEMLLAAGTGYQTHSSGRWGDYSSMTIDPLDDCTFWYTQEYYAIIGSAPWQTRIGSFKFPSCTPYLQPVLSALPDINGSGSPELAVLMKDAVAAKNYAYVMDAGAGAQIKRLQFDANLDPLFQAVVPDVNSSGAPEIAILGVTYDASGVVDTIRVIVKDSVSGAWIKNIGFDKNFPPIAMAVVEYPSGHTASNVGIAVLGRRAPTGGPGTSLVKVSVRDAVDGSLITNTYYMQQFQPVAMAVVPDYTGTVGGLTNAPEIAVLGERDADVTWGGVVSVIITDVGVGAANNGWVTYIGLESSIRPVDIAVLPDMNANGSPEIAVLGVNRTNGNGKVVIREPVKNGAGISATINALIFPKEYPPLSMAVVPDMNGNGVSEIAVFGLGDTSLGAPAQDRTRVSIRDASASPGVWIGSLFYSEAFPSNAMVVIDNYADVAPYTSAPEIAVLGTRASDNKMRVTVKDILYDTAKINDFFVP